MTTRTKGLAMLLAIGALTTWALAAGAGAQGTPRTCRAADLAGAIIDVQGAAGSRDGRLILVNSSSHACRLRGFPGATLVARSGRRLATNVHHAAGTVRTVTLPSGSAAASTIHWNVIPSGTQRCATAPFLRVDPPPGGGHTVRVQFGDTACRGRLDLGPLTGASTV